LGLGHSALYLAAATQMKLARFLVFAGFILMLAGCESVSERISDRFDLVPPKTQSFDGDKATVFLAAQRALKRMDFVTTRRAAAQGVINARSGIRDTAVFGAGRQFTFEIRLRSVEPRNTAVDVQLIEILEGDFKAGATTRPLRVHGLYESFFEQLDRAMRDGISPVKPSL